jgi:phosphatidylglycerol:prolipoprotein diacylglycerol transferase
MHPILAEIAGVSLYAYGFLVAVAFAAALWIAGRRASRFGLSLDDVYDSAVPVLLSGLLGAKLLFLVTNGAGPIRSPADAVALLRGGFVFYGGLLGGTAGALWWLRRRGIPPLVYGDAVAPAIAIALAIGRLGCFFNGCCYGGAVSWGIVFPALADATPRHPTQLYEAGAALWLGVALLAAPAPPPARSGRVLGAFAAAYAVLRFGIEFLRDDPRGTAVLGLSPSQWLSLAGLGLGIWLLRRRPAGT